MSDQKKHHQLENTISYLITYFMGFPGGSDGKESVCNAGDPGSIPGLGRSPGEGNGYPLQYYSLENSTEKGACRATMGSSPGVAKSQTKLSVPY